MALMTISSGALMATPHIPCHRSYDIVHVAQDEGTKAGTMDALCRILLARCQDHRIQDILLHSRSRSLPQRLDGVILTDAGEMDATILWPEQNVLLTSRLAATHTTIVHRNHQGRHTIGSIVFGSIRTTLSTL